jgi:hypothetical protein
LIHGSGSWVKSCLAGNYRPATFHFCVFYWPRQDTLILLTTHRQSSSNLRNHGDTTPQMGYHIMTLTDAQSNDRSRRHGTSHMSPLSSLIEVNTPVAPMRFRDFIQLPAMCDLWMSTAPTLATRPLNPEMLSFHRRLCSGCARDPFDTPQACIR